MASWPTAIKSDVEGYIVIILAPTCHNGDQPICPEQILPVLYLRSKCEVTKYSDDLIRDDRRTNRPSNDNIHSFLSVAHNLIIEREKLEKSHSLTKTSQFSETHVLGTGERKHLNWKSRYEVGGEMNETNVPWLLHFFHRPEITFDNDRHKIHFPDNSTSPTH